MSDYFYDVLVKWTNRTAYLIAVVFICIGSFGTFSPHSPKVQIETIGSVTSETVRELCLLGKSGEVVGSFLFKGDILNDVYKNEDGSENRTVVVMEISGKRIEWSGPYYIKEK